MNKNKKSASEKSLLIDVGTAFITAGVLSMGGQNGPELSHVERQQLGSGSETSRESMAQLLDESLKILLQKYEKVHLKEVRVVVAAPWHEARIRTIVSHSEKPALISQKTVEKAIEQYKNEAPPKTGNVDIEALVMHVKINGYSTALTKPILGSSLELHYFESEMQQMVAEKIRTAALRAFPHAVVSFHSFPLVSSVALRSLSEETSFVVLDVAGEVTEVSVLYEDGIHHLSTIPQGYYGIARSVATKDAPLPDTLSRLALYARNELTGEEQTSLKEKFEKAFDEWVAQFETTLKSAAEIVPIPQTLFLISDRDVLTWLTKGFERKNTFSLAINPVSAPLVQNMLTIGDQGTYDIFLSLSALFFHTYKKVLIGE